jgi:glycosyltransferase involved in cell wall biosynthesis
MTLPFVSCLCPTYRSPDTLETAIECFRRQRYPADRRELLILEDAGEIPSQAGDGWRLVSQPNRAGSLAEKYNALVSMSRGSIVAVWEHDEFYSPSHLARHVDAIQQAGAGLVLAKDPQVWVDCHGWPPQLDGAGGRFHASLVLTRTLLDAVGGWPDTKDRDFDLRLIARLTARGQVVEPEGKQSYVFRWNGSGTWHAQHFMDGEDKAKWWDDAQKRTQPKPRQTLTPRLDANAQRLMTWFES